MATYDVFGVRGKSDVGTLDLLVSQDVCDDVSVRDRGHGREAIVLRLVRVDLGAVFLHGALSPLKFGAVNSIPLFLSTIKRPCGTYL